MKQILVSSVPEVLQQGSGVELSLQIDFSKTDLLHTIYNDVH